MSTIESNLDSIAQSLKIIADLLTVQTATKAVTNAPIHQAPVAAPIQVAAPVAAIPVPVVAASAAPVPAAPVTTNPYTGKNNQLVPHPVQGMPTLPVFTDVVPAAVQAGPTAPATSVPVFKDKQAMMDFVLSSYKALGTEKGAKIQDVLTGLGFRNINDAPPETWGALKAGIDSLKG